jgi:hypothetical protein
MYVCIFLLHTYQPLDENACMHACMAWHGMAWAPHGDDGDDHGMGLSTTHASPVSHTSCVSTDLGFRV